VSDLSIKVKKRNKAVITFDIEGSDHQYAFTPPKQAEMVLPMLDSDSDLEAAKAAFEWLDNGMSEDDRKHLSDRLRDKDDDLDIDAVEDIVTALVEKAGGDRPTT